MQQAYAFGGQIAAERRELTAIRRRDFRRAEA
jgi:hypothetical protein